MSLETSLTTLTAEAIAAVARDRAQVVLDWLTGLPPSRSIGLLGVSQGAVLGLHLIRMAPAYFSYAVNLSGYVLAGEEAGDAALLHMQPPVFWGRGRSDTVVPSSYIERTQTWLSLHSTLSAHVYPVGHEETPRKFAEAGAFVTATVQVS
jgi:phospholipase/carboxylesterase